MGTRECAVLPTTKIFHPQMMSASPSAFAKLGTALFRNATGLARTVPQRRFRALFGVALSVCARVWALLDHCLPIRARD